METDAYDEPMTDQDPREAEPDDKEESQYQSFLAPKSSFPSGLEVGSTHNVRVEAIHGDEVELVCTGKGSEEEESSAPEENDSGGLYE